MTGVAGLLEMRTRGVEVAGRAACRGDGAGLGLTDGVDVQTMEARCQLARCGRLDREGGEAAREFDVGGGDRGAVGEFQLGSELLAARARTFAGLTVALGGRRGRRRRAGPDR